VRKISRQRSSGLDPASLCSLRACVCVCVEAFVFAVCLVSPHLGAPNPIVVAQVARFRAENISVFKEPAAGSHKGCMPLAAVELSLCNILPEVIKHVHIW